MKIIITRSEINFSIIEIKTEFFDKKVLEILRRYHHKWDSEKKVSLLSIDNLESIWKRLTEETFCEIICINLPDFHPENFNFCIIKGRKWFG